MLLPAAPPATPPLPLPPPLPALPLLLEPPLPLPAAPPADWPPLPLPAAPPEDEDLPPLPELPVLPPLFELVLPLPAAPPEDEDLPPLLELLLPLPADPPLLLPDDPPEELVPPLCWQPMSGNETSSPKVRGPRSDRAVRCIPFLLPEQLRSHAITPGTKAPGPLGLKNPRQDNSARGRKEKENRQTYASHSGWSSPGPFTALARAACRRQVTGPGLPAPMVRQSTSRTGVTSHAVPVKKTSLT